MIDERVNIIIVTLILCAALEILRVLWTHAYLFLSFQRVKEEVQRRTMQHAVNCTGRRGDKLNVMKPSGHEQFHASLNAAKLTSNGRIQELPFDLPNSPTIEGEQNFLAHCTGQSKLLNTPVYEEPIKTVDGKP